MFYIQQQKLNEVFLVQNSATDHKLKYAYSQTKVLQEKKTTKPVSVQNILLKKSNPMKECFPETVLSLKHFNKIFI